jgi:hypothetical protein
MQTGTSEPEPAVTFQQTLPPVTSQRPGAQGLPPAEQVQIAPTPQVRPAPAPEIGSTPQPIVRPAPDRRAIPSTSEVAASVAAAEETSEESQSSAATGEKTVAVEGETAAKAVSPPSIAPAKSLTYWPSRVTSGAYGRVVQIGAFGSRDQAKNGWTYMARAYPGVKRLPAVVVEAQNSKGRNFYRFQIGTTSQAHSEVLCQRMQSIRLSCAIIGLPWKPKGVER